MNSREPRVIRVFISSPFRGMDRERDLLVKQVFPRLRERFAERGIRLIDVDLRWGITDEAVADGAVLPTCLDEIERCRPFFVGLLGERYGYILDTLPAEVLSLEPKLARLSRCSVTAIEVEHALSVPKSVPGVFFYFRDPNWVQTLPADERSANEETSSESVRRLGELKDRIRASGHPVNVNYRTPEEAASLIESDLGALIDDLFPSDKLPTLVADSHRAFASERRKFWVGHDLDIKSTLSALESNPVVLITGGRGTGISAFLANCADAVRQRKPQMLVVEHYTQAHLEATTVESTCRQIISVLAHERALAIPTSTDDHEWPELLLEQLTAAATKGPILLVIDGADRLGRWSTGITADWLPAELPQGVSILASLDIDDAQYQTGLTGWPVIQIDGLSVNDKKSFITEYLARYRKELDAPLTDNILASEATSQPFYLLLLLQELRQHGYHDTLADRLGTLLAAKNVEELSALVFNRCELDFHSDTELTGNALRYLCIARLGLSDVELCELIGENNARLPQRLWSPLRLALGQILVSSDGLLRFTRGSIRRTAEERYLTSGKEERRHRKHLLAYFASKPLTPRVVLEISFQLSVLEAWEELAEYLRSPHFFVIFAETSPEELARAWARVEEHTRIRAATTHALLGPKQLQPLILRLLRNLDHWTDAVILSRLLAETAIQEGDTRAALLTYLEIGYIELEAGSNVKAHTAFVDAYNLATKAGTPIEQLLCLQGQQRAKRSQLSQLMHSKSVVRAELGRELRLLTARVHDLTATSADPELQLAAQTGRLQDLCASGIKQEQLTDLRRLFGSFIAGRHNESGNVTGIARTLISQTNTAAHRMQREHSETKEAIQNLRLTRYRGLALLAEAQLASFEGRHEELQQLLPVLARHGMSHDDATMLAFVHGEYADCTIGEQRLYYLEQQAEPLKRLARRTELFLNLWEQLDVLCELGHKDKARLLMREMRGIRKTITLPIQLRFFFWFSRFDMMVDQKLAPHLWRYALWIFGPPWLYLMWQFEKWAGRWFLKEPFTGAILLLASAPMLFAPAMMLLDAIIEATKALMRRFGQRDKVFSGPEYAGSSPTTREETPAQNQDCSSDAPLIDTSVIMNDPVVATLSRLSPVMLPLAKLQRSKIRAHRIATYLDLYNTGNSLTWMAISFSLGVALTTSFWLGQGWWRVLSRPLGVLGILFILEAVLTPVLLVLRRRDPTSSRISLREMERNASRTLCMVALIRLKRRIFGKRRRP